MGWQRISPLGRSVTANSDRPLRHAYRRYHVLAVDVRIASKIHTSFSYLPLEVLGIKGALAQQIKPSHLLAGPPSESQPIQLAKMMFSSNAIVFALAGALAAFPATMGLVAQKRATAFFNPAAGGGSMLIDAGN
ncbi:hypothetical protein FKP32DRAFT_1670759, partial [Trametes sanguinea]